MPKSFFFKMKHLPFEESDICRYRKVVCLKGRFIKQWTLSENYFKTEKMYYLYITHALGV